MNTLLELKQAELDAMKNQRDMLAVFLDSMKPYLPGADQRRVVQLLSIISTTEAL
jgi:hypothetical protein